jgi:hypothetical protein
MTDTINDMTAETGGQAEPTVAAIDERGVAEQPVAQAREKGIELVAPNGLLSQLTKRVLETALEGPEDRHRVEEPRGGRCVHCGVRRSERAARCDQHRLGAHHRAGVHHSPDPKHAPLRVAKVPGPDRSGSVAGLHRRHRGRSPGPVRRVHREVGQALSSDQTTLGERLERVSCPSWTTTWRSARSSVRQRVVECPLPPRRAGPRPLSQRAGRA